jgi:beta-xylosidase
MESRRNCLRTLRIFFGLFSLFAGTCGQPPVFTPGDEEVDFRDDFSTALKEGWVLDGSNVDVSLTDRSGFLTLFPPSAIPTGEQAATTVLLREREGNFVVVTKLEFQTITDLQSAGVVVQGDDGRTVLLGVSEINQVGFRGVLMLADRGPGTERGRALVRSDLQTIFLRLEREGNRYTGAFSTDGVSFTAVGTLTNDLSPTVKVGVGTLIAEACSSNCDERVPAEFDFFEVRSPAP